MWHVGGEVRCIQSVCEEILGKETIWNTRHRGEDNTVLELQEVGWGGTNWIDLSIG
jgi:hypothetical protein